MAFSQEVQDLTNSQIAPKIVDGILSGNIAAFRFIGNGKKFRGHNHPTELKYQKTTLGGSYSGMGNFSTSVEANTVKMTSEPKSYAQPVTVENLTLAVNKNDGIIDYLKYRMESAKEDMIDNLGTIFYGSGAGNDFDGLAKIVDNGAVSATYRGLTRASYDALDAYVSTSVGTLTLDHLAALDDGTNIGKHETTIWLTTKANFSIIERLLFPTTTSSYNAQSGNKYLTRRGFVQGKEGLQGHLGFRALAYRGKPIVADDKCTSGYLYALNEDFLYWAGLTHPEHGTVALGESTIVGMNEMPSANHGIAWTGLKEPINADGETGQFLLYGQLICDSPRHQGVLQGISG